MCYFENGKIWIFVPSDAEVNFEIWDYIYHPKTLDVYKTSKVIDLVELFKSVEEDYDELMGSIRISEESPVDDEYIEPIPDEIISNSPINSEIDWNDDPDDDFLSEPISPIPEIVKVKKVVKRKKIKDIIQVSEFGFKLKFKPRNKKVVKFNLEPEAERIKKIHLEIQQSDIEARIYNEKNYLKNEKAIAKIIKTGKIKLEIKQAEHDKQMVILQVEHDKRTVIKLAERDILQAEHDKEVKILQDELKIIQAENIKEVRILQDELKIIQAENIKEVKIQQPDDNNSQIIVEQIEAESEDEDEDDHPFSCGWCYQVWNECMCICDKCSNPKNVCKNDKSICWELEKKKIAEESEAEESEDESDNNSPINCGPKPEPKLSTLELIAQGNIINKNRYEASLIQIEQERIDEIEEARQKREENHLKNKPKKLKTGENIADFIKATKKEAEKLKKAEAVHQKADENKAKYNAKLKIKDLTEKYEERVKLYAYIKKVQEMPNQP